MRTEYAQTQPWMIHISQNRNVVPILAGNVSKICAMTNMPSIGDIEVMPYGDHDVLDR